MDFFSVIISGIASGSAYALLALGIVIIFRSTDTVNFALGDTGTFAAFVAIAAIASGAPVIVALGVAIATAALMGVATERLLIRPLGHGRQIVFISLVMTIGLSLVLQAAMGAIWGHIPVRFAPVIPGDVSILGFLVPWNKVAATLFALLMMALVGWFFAYHPLGIAMRAGAEDPEAAHLIGLSASRMSILAWAMGCGLAAVGMFFLATSTSLHPTMANQPLFRAFAGVFLGGLTSMPGAVIGGFAIGVLDNVAGRYISADYRDTVVFSVIIAILFLRPAGFLGVARRERV